MAIATTSSPTQSVEPAAQAELPWLRSRSNQAGSGLAILYLVIAGIAWATWGATANALIDFGREIYVPWQLAEGRALYRDIAYFNGPISPWFNAMLLKSFGTSIQTLFIANACILAASVTMMYALLVRQFSVVAATAACAIMIAVTGVAHVNYNFLTPYSHEMTHGVFLCLAILCLISKYEGRFHLVRWGAAGICSGLVFLGKPEIFVAATVMIVCSLTMRGWMRVSRLRDVLLQMIVLGISAALVVVVCFFILRQQLDTQWAWQGLFGGWLHILGSDITRLPFYQSISGLADPGRYLFRVFKACVGSGSLLLGLFLLEKKMRKSRWRIAGAMLLLLPLIHMCGYRVLVLHEAAFSVIASLMLVTVIYSAWKQPYAFDRFHLLSCWSAFGLLLMAKIILRTSFGFYGFVLVMPALVLAVAMAIDWLPEVLYQRTSGSRFRFALIVLLAAQTITSLIGTLHAAGQSNVGIGMGSDCIRSAGQQGELLKNATDLLRRDMLPGQTLLVLPEGVAVNYLLRRESPTPFINFMQPELVMYGEAVILRRLEETPGDYILLVSRRLPDYGLEYFGQPGYGDQIMTWVKKNYVLQQQFGGDPSVSANFGIQVLKFRSKQVVQGDGADNADPEDG